jgi:hypothetical protein
MEPPEKWPMAMLSPQDLQKLHQLESKIHADCGKSNVLIDYQYE